MFEESKSGSHSSLTYVLRVKITLRIDQDYIILHALLLLGW